MVTDGIEDDKDFLEVLVQHFEEMDRFPVWEPMRVRGDRRRDFVGRSHGHRGGTETPCKNPTRTNPRLENSFLPAAKEGNFRCWSPFSNHYCKICFKFRASIFIL